MCTLTVVDLFVKRRQKKVRIRPINQAFLGSKQTYAMDFYRRNGESPGRSQLPAGCPSAAQRSLGPFVAVPELEVIKTSPALSTIEVNTREPTSTTVDHSKNDAGSGRSHVELCVP